MKNQIFNFLPLAAAITLIFGVIYVTQQGQLREGANNPQIEIAENAVDMIKGGAQPFTLFTSKPIDIENRLTTFTMVYNSKGELIGSNAHIGTTTPAVSKGVLDVAKAEGGNRVTWEPQKGSRYAIVVEPFEGKNATSSGFVVAGRSLKEIETRERNLLIETVLGWISTLVITSFVDFFIKRKTKI